MATMKDVARLAQVSTATVSRTIMNPEKVSIITRKRVEEAILQTGYSANALTRHIRRNESKTIVVIVPNLRDPYFTDVIQGIEDCAIEHNYLVLLIDGRHSIKTENPFTNLIFTKQADGMLLLGNAMPFDSTKIDIKSLPPMVMACEYAPDLQVPTIHIDNLTASFDAVNYLTKIGHRRIAEISGPQHSALCKFRHQGYQQALRRASIDMLPNYCVSGNFSLASGEIAASKLLSQRHPPTAIFCHNDCMAIGAIKQAKKQKFRVPQDVSIMGFDDIEYSQYCDPPLTTFAQPKYEIGKQAMLMLLDILKGRDVQPGSRLLEANLILRQSVTQPYSYHQG